VLRLALQTMRTRLHGFAGAFVALTIAVAVVTACGILIESGARASAPVERHAGSPVVVAANQTVAVPVGDAEKSVRLPEQPRIPAALAQRVAAVEGVQEVIADRSIPVSVTTTSGRTLAAPDGEGVRGHGWRSAALTPYSLTVGRAPRAANEVVLDRTLAAQDGVSVGDEVRITSTDGTETSTVAGLVRPPRGRNWLGAVFMTDARAASLAVNPARIEALGVFLESGAGPEKVAERIEHALGDGIAVLTGDKRGEVEARTATAQNEELVALGGAFGGIAVMLAIFVVAATLGLSVLQRGREIALLRTIGAKPRQIRRMLVGEAVIVALAAGLAGIAPGVLLASLLFGALQGRGIGAETATLVVSPLPILIAVGIGVVTAALAAWLGGRRAARIRPTAALAEAALEPRRIGWIRLLLGLGFLAGGALLCVASVSLDGEAAVAAAFGLLMILMVAVGLLGPLLARIGAAVFGPSVARLFPTSGFIAMANIRTRARRFASASTPIALGVAFSVALIGSVTVPADAAERQSRDRLLADRVLTASSGLPPGVLDEVRRRPGVAAVTGLMPTQVGAVYREPFDEPTFDFLPAVGVSPQGLDKTLELEVRDGSLAALSADGVAVSADRARSLDVGVGDEVPLWLGDGRRITARVVATYDSALGFGDVILLRALVAEHVTDAMDAQVLVTFAGGADVAALDTQLAALTERTPGLEVLNRAGLHAAEDQEAEASAWVNYLIIGVLMAFIAIAAVNSLVMATGERAGELALLRLVGATPKQVIRTIRWEALAVIGFGVVIGLAVAAATLVPFSLAIAETAVPYLPWQVVAGVVAGAVLLGLGASELPARNALRRDPIELMGAQE
jgi:putative ABC transport system permease protein